PKFEQNQFGFSAGGPVIKNRTHFFGAYEATRIRQATIFNSPVPSPDQRNGDFSATGRVIRDPLNGQPFPGNVIPRNRFSGASVFFYPYMLESNSAPSNYRGTAPLSNTVNEYTARIDHMITDKQRVFWRGIWIRDDGVTPNYSPAVVEIRHTPQYNLGLGYTYVITPSTLLTVD